MQRRIVQSHLIEVGTFIERKEISVKRLLLLTMAVAMIVALMPPVALADMPVPLTTDLTADGGEDGAQVDVGDVSVYNDVASLYVSYQIDEDLAIDPNAPLAGQEGKWCITGTHLDVQEYWEDIPQTTKGVPIPGQFAYDDIGLYDCEQSAAHTVPNSWASGTTVSIAAHADVQQLVSVETDLPGFEAALPDQVSMTVAYPGGDSYFNTTVSNDGDLNGTYDGWCIDIGHTITPGVTYLANVYSSYEDLPEDIPNIDKPENLDLVNYIINNYSGDGTPYTMCDVQKAIWTVIDYSMASCGSYNQDRVEEIVADATANGAGFVPPCGGFVAVILIPVNLQQAIIAQITTIQVGVECEAVWEGETAWGGDYPEIQFPGKTWGIYFEYNTVQ